MQRESATHHKYTVWREKISSGWWENRKNLNFSSQVKASRTRLLILEAYFSVATEGCFGDRVVQQESRRDREAEAEIEVARHLHFTPGLSWLLLGLVAQTLSSSASCH